MSVCVHYIIKECNIICMHVEMIVTMSPHPNFSLMAFQARLAAVITAITAGGGLVSLTGSIYNNQNDFFGRADFLVPYYGVGMAGGLLSAICLVS